MTDPTRLLDSRLDSMSRGALEAAIADEPPEGAKAQLWQSIALGLPAAGVLLGATTTASGAAASTAAVGTGSASATTATGLIGAAASVSVGANAVAVSSGAIGGAVAAAKVGASAVGASAVGASAVGASAVGAATVGATASVGMGLIAVKAVAIGLGIGLAATVATDVGKRAFAPQPTGIASAAMSVPAASGQRTRTERQGSLARNPSIVLPPTVEESAPSRGGEVQIENRPAPARDSEAQIDKAAVTALSPPLPNPRQAATALQRAAESTPGEPNNQPESQTDELREENQLILRARQAQLSSRHRDALELVSEHSRRFPNGRLCQERDAIEVQSLEKLSRNGEARIRAKAFLERYPLSPHAERIRAVLEGVPSR